MSAAAAEALRARRGPWPARAPGGARVQRNLVYGQDPGSGKALRADLWLPGPGTAPSGLGAIYAHGSGWRVGAKDLGTRPFFRRLTNQGHVVLDIDVQGARQILSRYPDRSVAIFIMPPSLAVLE